jgi:DNA-binding NtrC family response regulator
MAAHILQIAYYPTLQDTRARMLEAAGYRVTSVMGNDDAIRVNERSMGTIDLALVGFCAPYTIREAMVHWLKTHSPDIPVIALQFHEWEDFPEADASTLSENPQIWLSTVANLLKA